MSKDLILRIECQLKSFYCERRFPVSIWTVGDFRLYVEQLLDIEMDNLILLLNSQELTIDQDNDFLSTIENLKDHSTITVDSHRPSDDIDDVNRLPEKYRMTDEAYAQRKGTLRDYLQRNKIGKYSDHRLSLPSSTNQKSQERRKLQKLNHLKLKKIEIGMHVQVNESMSNTRQGEVVYIGMLRGIPDEFIGIIFDGPWGDCNGCDGIIQYFDAKRKHASFIRPEYIEIISNHLNNFSLTDALDDFHQNKD